MTHLKGPPGCALAIALAHPELPPPISNVAYAPHPGASSWQCATLPTLSFYRKRSFYSLRAHDARAVMQRRNHTGTSADPHRCVDLQLLLLRDSRNRFLREAARHRRPVQRKGREQPSDLFRSLPPRRPRWIAAGAAAPQPCPSCLSRRPHASAGTPSGSRESARERPCRSERCSRSRDRRRSR
jgi:hypothetical protein